MLINEVIMDDFNNFFDDQRQPEPSKTPIYHTPEPKNNGSKRNLTAIICIIVAVIMCVLVVVNVIVLSTLKNKIAAEYASSVAAQMKSQYEQAINSTLSDTGIVADVTEAATRQTIDAINSTVGEVANKNARSVARLYMFESANARPSTTEPSGLATAFLISDTDADGNKERYLLTNAHCIRYVKSTVSGGGFWSDIKYSYEWASYGTIVCVFEGENNYYYAEIVSYGAYNDKNLRAENDQPDLAILRIKGAQPSNENHPSLPLATSDNGITRGTPVALIGNPEGVGDTNSITSGTISQTGITITSWGPGTFIMTDAAVNGGNSGGPMLNNRGIVIGVVESKLVSDDIDNMGFAISAATVYNFIEWAQRAANNSLRADIVINCKYV